MKPSRCLVISAPVDTVLGARTIEAWLPMLAPHERSRQAAIREPMARRAYIAAHILVRRVAGRLLERDPSSIAIAQRCEVCGGPHGRPTLANEPGIHLSLSHTRRVVAAAASHAPIGIDVEDLEAMRYEELRETRVFSAQERQEIEVLSPPLRDEAAAQLWVRKECMVKLGLATLDDLTGHASAAAAAGCVYASWRHAPQAVIGAAAGGIAPEVEILE